MKILQIHNLYRTRGGEESVVQSERELLEAHGHEVIPFYRDSRDIDSYGPLARLRVFSSIPYSRAVERELSLFVRQTQPDVAHVHNVFPMLTPAVYRALARCGIPVVQTIHNYRFLCPNGQLYIDDRTCEACQHRGYFSAIRKRCMHRSILISGAYAAAVALAWRRGILPNNIDRYIALNRFSTDLLTRAGVPASRIRILGNFVSEIADHISPKCGYIVYLGRLSREKGIRTLLDAMQDIDGVVLKIAGDGPLSHEIEEWIVRMGKGNIELLGYVSGAAKQQLIRGAMSMVVPSEWYENFPISVVESMSHGTPVVASKIGGLPELIDHGVNGLLFESGDSDALALALRQVVTDTALVAGLAENALRTAQERFGRERHYEGLLEIYNQALQDREALTRERL